MVKKSDPSPKKRKATEIEEPSMPLAKKSKRPPAKEKKPAKEKEPVKEKKIVKKKTAPKPKLQGKFDPHLFKAKYNCDEYKKNFSKRPVLLERQLLLPTYFPPLAEEQQRVCKEFSESISKRGWQKLLVLDFMGFEEIVLEFYSNISSAEGEYRSYVRGKIIHFDPSTLNSLLEIPELEEMGECHMRDFEPNSQIVKEDFDDILCDGQPEWIMSQAKKAEVRCLLQQSMNMKAKLWWTVVQGILLPIKHKNTITHKRLWCLRILMMNQHIDVGLTIAREIKLLHKTKMASLTYVAIISELCKRAGVDFDDMKPMKPKKPIDLGWMFENLPKIEKTEKKAEIEKLKGKKSQGDEGTSAQPSVQEVIELQCLMAPIVIQIAERLGIDASSLKNSPLLHQFQKTQGDASNIQSKAASSSSQRSKVKSTSPPKKIQTQKSSSSSSSSAKSVSSSATPPEAEITPVVCYNPLTTEIPTSPIHPLAEELAAPLPSPEKPANAPSLGSIELRDESPNSEQGADDDEGSIDYAKLDEVVASLQPEQALAIIKYQPLKFNLQPPVVVEVSNDEDERNQAQQAATARAIPAAIRPPRAIDLNLEAPPFSPTEREAAHTMVSVFSTSMASMSNLEKPAPSSSPKETLLKDVYQRKKKKKARSG